jgi:hypothetical protein
LLEAIALPAPPRSCGLRASAFLAVFCELPPELRFEASELVARRAAEALAIGCDSLAEDAPGAAETTAAWWGAAARGRDVLSLLRHFPPAVRAAALACLRAGGPRASDAAVDRYRALFSGAHAGAANI